MRGATHAAGSFSWLALALEGFDSALTEAARFDFQPLRAAVAALVFAAVENMMGCLAAAAVREAIVRRRREREMGRGAVGA